MKATKNIVLLTTLAILSVIVVACGVPAAPPPPSSGHISSPAVTTAPAATSAPNATTQDFLQAINAGDKLPVLFTDWSADNPHDWKLLDSYGDGSHKFSIKDGKYNLEVHAADYALARSVETAVEASDFYAQLDVQQVSGKGNNSYGMLFRTSKQWAYHFLVTDEYVPGAQGKFRLDRSTGGSVWYLIEEQDTPLLKKGQVNRLGVLALGSQITLFINNQMVGQVEDTNLTRGGFGVYAKLTDPGDAVFEYSNLAVYFPPSVPSVSTSPQTPTVSSAPTLDGSMAMGTAIFEAIHATQTAEPLRRQETATYIAIHGTPELSRPLLSGSRIAFLELPNPIANWGDVYVGTAEGATQFQLGTDGGVPVWSPSGQQIAFQGGCVPAFGCLTIMNTDGTNRRLVENWGGGSPIWSPDGCKLLGFSTLQNAFQVNADGSKLQPLASWWDGEWMPDGEHFIYSSGNSISTSDLDGKNTKELISGTSILIFTLSPDGSHLVYFDTGRNGINMVYLPTKQKTQIAKSGQHLPVWSPDGQRLAVIGTIGGEFHDRVPGPLTIFSVDGSDGRVLAQDAIEPTWSPDGTQIAYVSAVNFDYQIHIVNVDGTGDRSLYSGKSPAWAPSAKKTKC